MKKIKTFEGACKQLKLDPKKVLPKVTGVPAKHRASIVAYAKLVIIAQALNGGWQPDWKNADEWKYYPWFDMSQSSASGLAFDVFGNQDRYSTVGSRLCFKSRELAEYAGKQFKKLYAQYFLI